MGEAVIAVQGLTKRYGKAMAVDGIDLRIERGEIFGLLGPNGAGKTTTILMLLGLTEVDGGEISVCGFDPRREPLQVKRQVGYLPDAVGFYDNLTARENLGYTARLAGISRAEAAGRIATALNRVRLSHVADKKVGTFSRGMRQRLGLAEVLMRKVEVAILDEPTSGLDPQSTAELLDMIRELKSDGVAVLLSSHLLDRVQVVCDRVALFRQGKIALQGTVSELARSVLGGGHTINLEVRDIDLRAALATVTGIGQIIDEGEGRWRITCDGDKRAEIAAAVLNAHGSLLRLNVEEPSLELVYTHYFREARDAA